MSDEVVVNPQGDLVVIPPHTDGNVVGRGVIDLINEVSDRVDGIESGGGAGPQGPQGIPGPAGPTIYPATGIAVSTGTAWATSIDPATVPRLNTANTFTAGGNFSGNAPAFPSSLRLSGTAATMYIDAQGPDAATVGSLSIRSLSSDFSTGVQWLYGGDGILNLANAMATIDLAGNAHFSGTVTSGAVNLTKVIAELQARVAALETK